MANIIKVEWNGLQKNETVVLNETWEQIKTTLHSEFKTNPDVARYEEMKFSVGSESVSLKDRCNKVIIQYKLTKK